MTSNELYNMLRNNTNKDVIVGEYCVSTFILGNLSETIKYFIAIAGESYYVYDQNGIIVTTKNIIGFGCQLNVFCYKDRKFTNISLYYSKYIENCHISKNAEYFLFDNAGKVVLSKFFGIRLFNEKVFSVYTRKIDSTIYNVQSVQSFNINKEGKQSFCCDSTTYSIDDQSVILKLLSSHSDYNFPVYVNNKHSEYLYWKSIHGVDLFLRGQMYYVYDGEDFVSLCEHIALWYNDNSKYTIVSFSIVTLNAKEHLNRLIVKTIRCDKCISIREAAIYFFGEDNLLTHIFVGRHYLAFSKDYGCILVIDEDGRIMCNKEGDESFCVNGFSGDYLYHLSQYSLKVYDVKGTKIGDENVYLCHGENGLYPILRNGGDYLITKESGRYGVTTVNGCKRILPNVFSKVVVVRSNILTKNLEVGRTNECYAFYVELESSDKSNMCGVFTMNQVLIPIGKYVHVIPLVYKTEKVEYKIEKAHDRWHCDKGWNERSYNQNYSGWFLCIDDNGMTYLKYYDNKEFEVDSLISVVHPKNVSLYLEVNTKTGKGILSPFGWVVKPNFKFVQQYQTNDNSIASHFESKVVFRINSDIIRIYVKTSCKDKEYLFETYSNQVVKEVLFDASNRYVYMSEASATFGINVYYKDITDNSKIGINLFCSCAKQIAPYSESGDYSLLGKYNDEDKPWPVDDFGSPYETERDRLKSDTIVYKKSEILSCTPYNFCIANTDWRKHGQ